MKNMRVKHVFLVVLISFIVITSLFFYGFFRLSGNAIEDSVSSNFSEKESLILINTSDMLQTRISADAPLSQPLNSEERTKNLITGDTVFNAMSNPSYVENYTFGVCYNSVTADYGSGAFLRTYQQPEVRAEVIRQLQNMSDSGVTRIFTFLSLVSATDTYNGFLSFPISEQEIANIKQYTKDVASIKSKDGTYLKLEYQFGYMGCADYKPSFLINPTIDLTSNGGTWIPLNTGSITSPPRGLASDWFGYFYVVTTGGKIYRSMDGGGTWELINLGYSSSNSNQYGLGNIRGNLFAFDDAHRVFKSIDKGVTWAIVNSDYFTSDVAGVTSIDPALFVVTKDGKVHKSVDNGATWMLVNDNTIPSNALGITSDSGILYIVTDSQKIYSSSDSGVTWSLLKLGYSTQTNLRQRGIAYLRTHLFAFDDNNDVLRASDSTKSQWSVVNSNYFDGDIIGVLSNRTDLIAVSASGSGAKVSRSVDNYTLVGWCGYNWPVYRDYVKQSITSLLSNVGGIKRADGQNVLDYYYLEGEETIGGKTNEEMFLLDLYLWAINEGKKYDVNVSVSFGTSIVNQQRSFDSTFVDPLYPQLNGKPWLYWVYRSKLWFDANNLPVPTTFGISFYSFLPDYSEGYDFYYEMLNHAIDDIHEVFPSTTNIIIPETFYYTDPIKREALGKSITDTYLARGVPTRVSIWTTPDPFTGGAVGVGFPFDFTSYLLGWAYSDQPSCVVQSSGFCNPVKISWNVKAPAEAQVWRHDGDNLIKVACGKEGNVMMNDLKIDNNYTFFVYPSSDCNEGSVDKTMYLASTYVYTQPIPTCTDFTYTDWGECSDSGKQLRSILTSLPEGCVGGNPEPLEQSCTPACTESNWQSSDGTCQSNNLLTRTWTKVGTCTGGITHPATEQISCTYVPTCDASNWQSSDGTCQSNNLLTRTWTKVGTCTGGITHPATEQISCTYIPLCTDSNWEVYSVDPLICPVEERQTVRYAKIGTCEGGVDKSTPEPMICTYDAPECNYIYSDWGECNYDGTMSRIVLSVSPDVCQGLPDLNDICTYIPACQASDWDYNDAACQSNNQTNRTWTKVGTCDEGKLGAVNHPNVESVSCNYVVPICTNFTYSNWSDCISSGTRGRIVLNSEPLGCEGGNPILSETCSYVPPSSSSGHHGGGGGGGSSRIVTIDKGNVSSAANTIPSFENPVSEEPIKLNNPSDGGKKELDLKYILLYTAVVFGLFIVLIVSIVWDSIFAPVSVSQNSSKPSNKSKRQGYDDFY